MTFNYIDSNKILLDSFRLGKKVYDSGFIPTHAVSLWRGGTVIGLGVNEYFRLKGHFINHTTIATTSYNGIGDQSEVVIKGLEHLIDVIATEDKLLIIDDIYDSGRTIDAVIKAIKTKARRNAPKQILVACIHKKERLRQFHYDTITLYDVPNGTWLSYPHEISELLGVDDGDKKAITCKSKEICDILATTNYPIENIDIQQEYKYLDANELLLDSMKLATNIYHDDFIPNFLIAIWPTGVSVGLPLHEYFKYKLLEANKKANLPDHISINTCDDKYSYKSQVIGIRYLEERINYEDKILIVAANFSTGRLINDTILKLKQSLRNNINLNNIKVATVYYTPTTGTTCINTPFVDKPHYYLKKTNKPVILPQQIHKLNNANVVLPKLNSKLAEIIY